QALLVRAAVAHRAGLLEKLAVGRLDVLLGWLAFHPVRPLVRLHLGLRRLEHGAVVALAVQVRTGPAVEEPVDELVRAVELAPAERGGQAEACGPRAIA